MPLFFYHALDGRGQTCSGQIYASCAKDARAALRQQELVPLALKEIKNKDRQSLSRSQSGSQNSHVGQRWWQRSLYTPPALNAAQLAVWTRQLSSLLSAGLTIERSLASLLEEAQNPPQRRLISTLLEQVKAGSALSSALEGLNRAEHGRVFNAVYRAVVSAGERSGTLAQLLERLASEQENAQALKGKLLGAALYPAIVTSVALMIVTFLMLYVVPQIASAFVGAKQALPFLTQIMLSVSAWLKGHWSMIVAFCLLGGAALMIALMRPRLRLKFDSALLRLPLLGGLIGRYNAARFASTLGVLMQAGVPILSALEVASGTANNAAMRQDLQDVQRLVREGSPLAVALASKARFPKLLSTFARLGAETGQAGEMLGRVGTQLGQQVQQRAMNLAAILEPLLIVLMGAAVLVIVLAVLLPIIQLTATAP